MSLEIKSTGIEIRNRANVLKFNSSDKLLYQKNLFQGTVTLNSGTVEIPLSGVVIHSFDYTIRDYISIFIKINSCNGNLSNQYLNSQINLSAPLLLSFVHSTTSVDIIQQNYLSGSVSKNLNGIGHVLKFNYHNYSNGINTNFATNNLLNFNYLVRIFGWR